MTKFSPATANPVALESFAKQLTWDELDPAYLRRLVEIARDEDLAGLGLRRRPRVTGDRSTASIAAAPRAAAANLVARESLVACGLPLLPVILDAYSSRGANVTVRLRSTDGARIRPGGVLATLAGDPRTMLAAERVMLNFLQRLSGIATQTRRYADALDNSRRSPLFRRAPLPLSSRDFPLSRKSPCARARHTRLLDTRKTTPAHRMLEKYAVARGGGWNHRLGLFDRVMLKDNHLALLGSGENLAAAVARAKRDNPALPVEVEVDRPAQIPAALASGADVILLDNFSPAALRRAVTLIDGRAFTEASGGVTLKTLPKLAALGLDFVSTGALVHQSVWVDIGLDWQSSTG
jgi:nicotinate-nucleotide pyrophosphorylase (carboxylating)